MAALAQVGEATWREALTRRGLRAIRAGSFERDTKVNRCLSEGRRAFLERLSGIESGAECERLAPSLSALADGEALREELASLRLHLKGCSSCRARLADFRAAPARVAALAPPAALAAQEGGGSARAWLESLLGAAQHKAASLGERIHSATELATGHKVAAVAASAAALASGGVSADRDHDRKPAAAERAAATHRVKKEPTRRVPVPVAPPEPPRAAPRPAPAPPPPTPAPDPAREFAPAAAAPPPSPLAGGAGGGSSAATGGEFSP
jgi:Putative zinc-finger